MTEVAPNLDTYRLLKLINMISVKRGDQLQIALKARRQDARVQYVSSSLVSEDRAVRGSGASRGGDS